MRGIILRILIEVCNQYRRLQKGHTMKKFNLFKFKPSLELVYVFINYISIVGMFYLSFQIITIKNVAGQFITFGVIGVLFLGILFPALYTTQIKHRTLSSMGIHKHKLLLSLGLSLIFAIIQYTLTLATIPLPKLNVLLPLLCMALTVGLFENIFFRGFVQLRLEQSFGVIPSIVLSSSMYCLYHVGYGMAGSEFLMLFVVGLVYASIFRLTRNVFILFPLLTPMGALFTNLNEGLIIPFESIIGFTLVFVSAIIGLVFIDQRLTKRS